MREAMEAIEAEAKERAGAKAASKAERAGADQDEITQVIEQARDKATPPAKAQRNFTDPESRIMKTADASFHYCYSGQAVVDEKSQVVLAGALTQQATDIDQLTPMIEAMEARLVLAGIEDHPKVLLADAGYCSNDNLEALAGGNLDVLVATGRLSHDERVMATPKGRIPKDRDSEATYGKTPSDKGRQRRLRPAQGDRRAGVRPDEAPTERWPSPTAAASSGRGVNGCSTSSVTTCASLPTPVAQWRSPPCERPEVPSRPLIPGTS